MKDEIDETQDYLVAQEIIAALPNEQREVIERVQKQQKAQLVRASISQIMARNGSHNLGFSISKKLKSKAR